MDSYRELPCWSSQVHVGAWQPFNMKKGLRPSYSTYSLDKTFSKPYSKILARM